MKPSVRCSGLDRRLNCFGAATLEAKLRDEMIDLGGPGDGDGMTWRGNWCHFESARRLAVEHGAIVPAAGLPAPALPGNWEPQVWDFRLVNWYLSNLLADTKPDHVLFVEAYYRAEFERFWLEGHIDVHTISPDETEADIDDLKAGEVPVDVAEENWQLLGYAVLLKRRYPKLKRVRARIFQRSADDPITHAIIDFEDGVDIEAFLERKIVESLANPRQLETGYKQCRLCPAIEFCPGLRKEIESMKYLLTEEELARLQVVPDLKNLAAVAAMGRAVARPIEKILEKLKERISIEGPVQLPDGGMVRLVDSPGRRKVDHVQPAFIVLAAKIGEDAAWKALNFSLTAAEDELVDTGMQRTSSKEGVVNAQGWINEHMNHLIQRPKIKKLLFT